MLSVKQEDSAFQVNQNALNYKGVYFEEEPEQKYFEGGAHFSHFHLCHKLEEIILTLSPERRGNSIYDTPDLSNSNHLFIVVISDSNTKAETRKIASDNSKEMIKKDKSQPGKVQNPCQRNKTNNNLLNNNSVAKTSKSGAIIKSVKETYKKIQPKNLIYSNNVKSSEKVSAVKLK